MYVAGRRTYKVWLAGNNNISGVGIAGRETLKPFVSWPAGKHQFSSDCFARRAHKTNPSIFRSGRRNRLGIDIAGRRAKAIYLWPAEKQIIFRFSIAGRETTKTIRSAQVSIPGEVTPAVVE